MYQSEKAHEEDPLVAYDTGMEESSPLIKSTKRIRSIDEALDVVGVGLFHVILIFVAGWALASDSVEVQCVSFVAPLLRDIKYNPDEQLKPDSVEEGALDAIIFVGMMFGGYFWGSWSDVVGRRSCLITSLFVNGLFGLASAFSPSFPWFLAFRFGSGVGVGGSLPVAFSYFCEFFSKKTRGPFVIILAAFWALGSLFAAAVAMLVLSNHSLREHVHVRAGSITITPWRIYIMLCTIPCLSAACALICLPESPSFLYSKRKLNRVIKILRRIQKLNRFCSKKANWNGADLSTLSLPESDDDSHNLSLLSKMLVLFRSTWKLFGRAYIRPTAVLLVIWFTFSFGYYGLLLWFPEYFKCTIEKQENCTFSTDNSSSPCAPPNAPPCNSTEDSIYLDSLYTALATIPGTILGIITVNLIGGKLMLSISVFVCGVSAFLIRMVPTGERNIVILSCLFNGVAVFGWNALDVITTSDLFPVHLRSTAFGIQAVFGRIGAILGNLAFGKLITYNPFIPILLVAAILMFGGVVGFVLPSPPGSSSLKKKCSKLCCLFRKFSRSSSSDSGKQGIVN